MKSPALKVCNEYRKSMQAVNSYWEEAHFIGHWGRGCKSSSQYWTYKLSSLNWSSTTTEGSLISYWIAQQMQRHVTWDWSPIDSKSLATTWSQPGGCCKVLLTFFWFQGTVNFFHFLYCSKIEEINIEIGKQTSGLTLGWSCSVV